MWQAKVQKFSPEIWVAGDRFGQDFSLGLRIVLQKLQVSLQKLTIIDYWYWPEKLTKLGLTQYLY
jgi:hypothetical protein